VQKRSQANELTRWRTLKEMREQSRSSGSDERWGTGAIWGVWHTAEIVKYVIRTVWYTGRLRRLRPRVAHPGTLALLFPEKEGVGERQVSGRRSSTKPACYVRAAYQPMYSQPSCRTLAQCGADPFTNHTRCMGSPCPSPVSLSRDGALQGLASRQGPHPCGGAGGQAG